MMLFCCGDYCYFFSNLVNVLSSLQLSVITQSCPTLCDPMNHSPPGFPVHHQLLEFTQTHVHRVSVAIQPSHPLLSAGDQPRWIQGIRRVDGVGMEKLVYLLI